MSQLKEDYEYVILGGGNAGGYACKQFVDLGITKTAKVCMVSSEAVLPYERPALSKGFLLKKDLELPLFNTCAFMNQRNEMQWYKDNAIEVKLSTTVKAIDFENSLLQTNENGDIKFGKLLLATGCSAVKFSDFMPKEKCGFGNIFYLRDINDARQIKQAMFNDVSSQNKECVIVGGGYIGMEVSAALCAAQCFKKITMIFPEEHMMAARTLFSKEMASKYHALYAKNGIEFVCGSLADSFEGDKDGNVRSVLLKDGRTISAQIVIVGIGGRPNVSLFADQLAIDQQTKGLKVNKYLQSESNESIFGCGDIASFHCPFLDEIARFEHVRHARSSAMFAVKAMTDKLDDNEKNKGYEFLPVFYSRVFGQSWEFYGDVGNNESVTYYKEEEKAEDTIKNRQFKLCSVWSGEDDVVSAILVDTDNEDEIKMAEKAVREKVKRDSLQEFVQAFGEKLDKVNENQNKL